jgi:hypothetical protein
VSDDIDDEGEADEVPPARRALDLLIFAPIGVALTVVEDLPGLIAKGRQRFETDIRNARVVGEFVVHQGQREVMQRMDKMLQGEPSGSPEETTPAGATADAPAPAPAKAAAPAAPAASPKPAPDPADGALVEGALAGYDTLSASQVVRRLESLGPDELRAVHRHEASHRNRRTILNRAQQLLEGAGATASETEAAPEAAAEPDRSIE